VLLLIAERGAFLTEGRLGLPHPQNCLSLRRALVPRKFVKFDRAIPLTGPSHIFVGNASRSLEMLLLSGRGLHVLIKDVFNVGAERPSVLFGQLF
jgi:hypothetical protein